VKPGESHETPPGHRLSCPGDGTACVRHPDRKNQRYTSLFELIKQAEGVRQGLLPKGWHLCSASLPSSSWREPADSLTEAALEDHAEDNSAKTTRGKPFNLAAL